MKEASEQSLVLRALCEVNQPKLTHEDSIIFQSFLNDIFPNFTFLSPEHNEFRQIIDQVSKKHHWTKIPQQIENLIQLYETMKTRHSTMLVGPTMFVHFVLCINIDRQRFLHFQEWQNSCVEHFSRMSKSNGNKNNSLHAQSKSDESRRTLWISRSCDA